MPAQEAVPDPVQVSEAGGGDSVWVVLGGSAQVAEQAPVEAQGRAVAVRVAGPELGAEEVVAAAVAVVVVAEKVSPDVGWLRPR